MIDHENDDNLTVVNKRVQQPDDTVPHNRVTATPVDMYRNNMSAPPPPPSIMRESAARQRSRQRRVTGPSKGNEWAWVIIAAALFAVVVISSMSVFLFLRASRIQQEVLPTAEAISALPTPVDFRGNGGVPGIGNQLVLDDGTKIKLEPWDGESRLTILMMGLDRRPGEKGIGFRTDTMMLISIDPRTSEIGVLSIPRDLYVEFPGFGSMYRINEAMVYGELRGKDYGPQLAMQTVQYNLGIRVHNYIAVDFNAFIQLVDILGGIEVDLDYNISDPRYPSMNYGYDPFYLTAGHHVLDGATALKFARTRHGDSDIQRAERQQKVLYAIRDKVLETDSIPKLLTQAPLLWNTLSENVYTGLTLEQIIQLGLYVKDVPVENIKTGVINFSYLSNYTTSQGASVLIPNRSRLGNLMIEVFGDSYSE